MKKYFVINLLLLSLYPAYCQVSFPDSAAIWNIVRLNYSDEPTGEIRYGLYGDTIIVDTVYHKLYILKDTTVSYENGEYLGAIREGQLKIWFKPIDWANMDILLYDFSKEIGDTLWYNAYLTVAYDESYDFETGDPYFRIVQDIYNTNESKRFILARSDDWTDEWIEGIGSIRGLFFPIMGIALSDHPDMLACYKQNDTVKYLDNPICSNCFCSYPDYIENECKEYNDVIIFPNPVSHSFTIQLDPSYSIQSIDVFNEMGIRVYSNRSNENQVILDNISNGIYFISIKIDDKILVKKVIF